VDLGGDDAGHAARFFEALDGLDAPRLRDEEVTDGATVAVGFGAARLPIGAIQRDAEDLAEKRYARGEERDVGIEAAAEAMGRFDQERTAGAVTDLRVAGAAVDAESAN